MKPPSPLLTPERQPLKPTTPLQPLMQTNVKPPSPMLAPEQRPLKPPTPLQPENASKTPISHPQRRRRFQLRLSLREQRCHRFQPHTRTSKQRCHRFHARDFRCTRAMAEPGRATRRRTQPHASDQVPLVWRVPEGPEGTDGLRDRPLRAAGSRVAISRAAGPDGARNTSGAASNKLNREFRLHRRCGGRKRAWLRRPRTAAGPGRASRRRAERSSRRGRRAGGPPPTGTQSSPAQQGAQSSPAPQGTARPAISGLRAPSGSPTRWRHPPGRAGAPNRRRRARDPRPRR